MINTLWPCSLSRCLKRCGCTTHRDATMCNFPATNWFIPCSVFFLDCLFNAVSLSLSLVLEPSISCYTPAPGHRIRDHGVSAHWYIFLQNSWQLELSACSAHSGLNSTSSSSLFHSVHGAIISRWEARPWSFPDGVNFMSPFFFLSSISNSTLCVYFVNISQKYPFCFCVTAATWPQVTSVLVLT